MRWLFAPLIAIIVAQIGYSGYQYIIACYYGNAFQATEFNCISRLRSLGSAEHLSLLRDPATGNSLLHFARDHDIISYLHDVGTDINSLNHNKETPLAFALNHSGDDYGAFPRIHALLMHGASMAASIQGATNRTSPLSVLWKKWDKVSKQRYNITKLLLSYQCDPASTDISGRTVLHYIYMNALRFVHSPNMQTMVEKSIEAIAQYSDQQNRYVSSAPSSRLMNAQDVDGMTALMYLVLTSSPYTQNITSFLHLAEQAVALGADPWLTDSRGGSSLCYAAFKGVLHLVNFLLMTNQQSSHRVNSSDVVACSVLSPAYEMNFEKDGVFDTLLSTTYFTLTKRHLELYTSLWDGRIALDPSAPPLTEFELWLLAECQKYNRNHQPNLASIRVAKAKMKKILLTGETGKQNNT